ncbi:MAG: translation elongation factor-like protein [bacterium]|nr:translation elongation factor-like protein [bacterium]
MAEILIGTVVDYFTHVQVAAIEITADELRLGDTIHILGHTTDLTFPVTSLQLEHHSIERAVPGQVVGVKCEERARKHDKVYKVV